jgi:hypothetical protein
MSKPDLHTRYREYLAKFKLGVDFTVDETTWIKKGRLKQLALGQGYSLKEIGTALRALERDVDIAIVWHSKDRTEYICRIPMTQAEIDRRIADNEWFDSLPG